MNLSGWRVGLEPFETIGEILNRADERGDQLIIAQGLQRRGVVRVVADPQSAILARRLKRGANLLRD
jgi:hypothetical protein